MFVRGCVCVCVCVCDMSTVVCSLQCVLYNVFCTEHCTVYFCSVTVSLHPTHAQSSYRRRELQPPGVSRSPSGEVYRMVGRTACKYIADGNMCLKEYSLSLSMSLSLCLSLFFSPLSDSHSFPLFPLSLLLPVFLSLSLSFSLSFSLSLSRCLRCFPLTTSYTHTHTHTHLR